MINTLFPEDNSQKAGFPESTCRECEHRERWQCGGKVIQYCGKRKSNRTFNKLLKIKVTDAACMLFKQQIAKKNNLKTSKMTDTLYRQVYCHERLPGKTGRYLTDMGLVKFIHTENEHRFTDLYAGMPTWWLEAVQIPTEKDLYTKEQLEEEDDLYNAVRYQIYAAGFKRCLELILTPKKI